MNQKQDSNQNKNEQDSKTTFNRTTLKEATKDYFEQMNLSEKQLANLESMLAKNTHGESKTTHNHKGKNNENDSDIEINNKQISATSTQKTTKQFTKPVKLQWFAMAASFLLALGVILTQLNPTTTNKQDISYLIAKEVAKNHMKLKPLDVKSGNFSAVSKYFSKGDVNFKPMPSKFLEKTTAKATGLLGARYCSVQSVTAAQIRYKNTDNQFVTFYEVGYDADKFGNIPDIDTDKKTLTHYVNGVKIEIWVEKGLLMASAVDVHHAQS